MISIVTPAQSARIRVNQARFSIIFVVSQNNKFRISVWKNAGVIAKKTIYECLRSNLLEVCLNARFFEKVY